MEDEKTLFSQIKNGIKNILGRTYFGRKYGRGSIGSQGGSSKLSSNDSVKKLEGEKDMENEYLRADIMEAEADADEDDIEMGDDGKNRWNTNSRSFLRVILVSDSPGESVGADQEADEMEKNDNLDPVEISEMENGGMEPDEDPTDDGSDTDGGSDGGEVSLARFLISGHFLVHFLRDGPVVPGQYYRLKIEN